MSEDTHRVRDLNLLEEIERDPDISQATLATRLGVAVGTVNWHLKRLIARGYVKVKKAERRKLRYLITPEGISLRAKLAVAYVENSMALYRQTRVKAIEALAAARREGHLSVRIAGEGDIADVCRLTCLEQGFSIMEDGRDVGVPVLEIDGLEISLRPPARE